jgi:TonB family protein
MKNSAEVRKPLVVTTLSGPKGVVLQSRVWSSQAPLALGYPFRWVLERTEKGVRISDLSATSKGVVREVSLESSKAVELLNNLWVRVQPARGMDDTATVPAIPTEHLVSIDDARYFRKLLIVIGGAMMLISLTLALLPKSEEKDEELIPPQFAKIVMTPAVKVKAVANAEAAASNEGRGAAKELTQAVKSKAVQKNIQGLLRGGMTALLKQSDILGSANAKAAVSGMFSGQKALSAMPISGMLDAKGVKVGTLGGESGTTAGGKNSVGYGKGEHAAVDGQGKSFVALDTQESTVEEGLTRDEVGRVIHAHMAEVRYCYESAMIRNPEVQGRLLVDFAINAMGNVKSAAVKESTSGDPSLDQCIIGHLMKWPFPHPKGGVTVAVSYPFIFKTLGR